MASNSNELKSRIESKRAISDLFKVFTGDYYINEKGYLQKLIDTLYDLGYYKTNESIFNIRKVSK